jgi:hypothetical protein
MLREWKARPWGRRRQLDDALGLSDLAATALRDT